jgi:FAD/FMN-containing dehydrogenase
LLNACGGTNPSAARRLDPLRASFGDRVTFKDETSFAAARDAIAWNGRPPHARSPEAIVQPASTQEVSAAVRFARESGLKIAVRGGGHNYYGASLREGSLLLNLARMNAIELDAAGLRARVQPARTGGELAADLARVGLAFPVGHCPDVPLSGYLLNGGLGWNPGTWGPACASVHGVEMVTADGEIVYANDLENTDLFWAARGAGPGFFAVVTRYDLNLHELPRAMRMFATAFALDVVPAAARWLDDLVPRLHPSVELLVSIGPDPASGDAVVRIAAFAFADSETEAAERLAPLNERPESLETIGEPIETPIALAAALQQVGLGSPKDKRMTGDGRWSNARPGELLSALRELARSAPPPPWLIGIASFENAPQVEGAAFSVSARSSFGAFTYWDSPSDDAARRAWVASVVDALGPYGAGSYVGEADLSTGPDRVRECFSADAWTRLARLKRRDDPDDVFFSYLTEPS